MVAELGGLVSADGRLVPDNILVRYLFRRWYSGILAGEASLALTDWN